MARPIPVRGHAALAYLAASPQRPALDALEEEELGVLRCHHLDSQVLVRTLGHYYPVDTLASPEGRMRAVSSQVPKGATVIGATALWVHTGGECPRRLTVAATGHARGRWRTLDISRTRLPPADTQTVAGLRCATLERACVDVARLAPPVEAVRAVMRARDAGASRARLLLALTHCQGAGAVGRPRAQRIIDAVMPPGQAQATPSRGRQ
ncbi:hypothetical protein D4740_00535 [Actinomyces sp. 2119]|uniref:hypothetical protein n=1 Tax=Actinomyces sp. 2119 TaxID=2321393 RepID=UPI000E6BB6A2|nr:hypothetical protein [Actinomyces sp. 2119]RJF44713.1 hypothetical protein D4740_00535 [Actinomyces sp. 2119]